MGLTVLGAFNAAVVVVGALILDVPLVGAIFLANSVLQNLVSPFAYGAALEVSPLILLLTALLGASFGGVIGVALAAPLTAIAMHSARLLRAPLPPVDHPA